MAIVIESVLIPVRLDTKALAASLERAEQIINERIIPIAANARAALKEALDFGTLLNATDLEAVQAGAGKIGAAVKAGLEDTLCDLSIGVAPAAASSGGEKKEGKFFLALIGILEKFVSSGPRGAALAAIVALLQGLTEEAEPLRLKRLAMPLHMPMEDFQTWRGAARKSGAREGDLVAFFTQMNKLLKRAVDSGRGTLAEEAKDLHIPLQDAEGKPRDIQEIVLDLAQAIRGMNKEDAEKTTGRLGIAPVMLDFLRLGREGIAPALERQRERAVYTEADAADAQRLEANGKEFVEILAYGLYKADDLSRKAGATLLEKGSDFAVGYQNFDPKSLNRSFAGFIRAFMEQSKTPVVEPNPFMTSEERLQKFSTPPARPFFRSHEEPDAGSSPRSLFGSHGEPSSRLLAPSHGMNDALKLMLDITAATRDTAAFLAEVSAEPRTVTNETTVSIDTIDIVTQATDAQGIAANIYDAVALQIVRGIPDVVDSGVRQAG